MNQAFPERFDATRRQLRRRWSDDFEAPAVAEALEPSSNISAIARRLDIHPSQLFCWHRAALGSREHSVEPS
ncbi:transposase [Pararhizobium arenae]|uniref:transposase n=1 Tax=Pararhizobium arenae TaxID=1856850 RepID=UPI00094B602F